MSWLGDYHVHTTYCDGKAEACVLAAQAAALGLATLGFSGHAYTDFDETWCMSRAGTRAYLETLQRLKRLYTGQLEILIGTELDYFSPPSESTYDYTIGSCHYVFADGAFLSVDESAEQLRQNVERYFSGDFLQFARHYYEQMANMQQKTGCTFIGHFDLLTKFNEGEQFFAEDRAYLSLAFDAADALCAQGAVFEINTAPCAAATAASPTPASPFSGASVKTARASFSAATATTLTGFATDLKTPLRLHGVRASVRAAFSPLAACGSSHCSWCVNSCRPSCFPVPMPPGK